MEYMLGKCYSKGVGLIRIIANHCLNVYDNIIGLITKGFGRFTKKPVHDWSSHGADAFRYLATGIKETKSWEEKAPTKNRTKHIRPIQHARAGGIRRSIFMSFLKPDVTVQSPEIKVPPPPPATPIKPITATATSEIEKRGRDRKRVATEDTILTGPKGVMDDAPVSYASLCQQQTSNVCKTF